MKRIIDFLIESVSFYVATVENGKPKIRPFGAAAVYEGKLYLATSNKKSVFNQVLANPNVAISCISGNKWMRIEGTLLVDSRTEAKQAILDAKPYLKNHFSIGDGIYEALYFSKGTASIYDFNASVKPEVIAL